MGSRYSDKKKRSTNAEQDRHIIVSLAVDGPEQIRMLERDVKNRLFAIWLHACVQLNKPISAIALKD